MLPKSSAERAWLYCAQAASLREDDVFVYEYQIAPPIIATQATMVVPLPYWSNHFTSGDWEFGKALECCIGSGFISVFQRDFPVSCGGFWSKAGDDTSALFRPSRRCGDVNYE